MANYTDDESKMNAQVDYHLLRETRGHVKEGKFIETGREKPFDFDTLSCAPSDREFVKESVHNIWRLEKNHRREVGANLLEIKYRISEHGEFMQLVRACFSMGQRTANRYMLLADFSDEEYLTIAAHNFANVECEYRIAGLPRPKRDIVLAKIKERGDGKPLTIVELKKLIADPTADVAVSTQTRGEKMKATKARKAQEEADALAEKQRAADEAEAKVRAEIAKEEEAAQAGRVAALDSIKKATTDEERSAAIISLEDTVLKPRLHLVTAATENEIAAVARGQETPKAPSTGFAAERASASTVDELVKTDPADEEEEKERPLSELLDEFWRQCDADYEDTADYARIREHYIDLDTVYYSSGDDHQQDHRTGGRGTAA